MQTDYKQIVRSTFDTVATGYDHPAMPFFPATAECLLQCLQLDPATRLLDVCTGTGVVAVRAAAAMPAGHVTGIDFSGSMLAQARHKARRLNLGNISFRQMDMEALEFADHRFDAATCSFGLFFIEDMAQCLRNIAAKVRPGGKVAISTFMADAFEPMASLFLRRYESFGRETREAAWKRIASESALRDLFAAAGMDDVEVYRLPLDYPVTVQDWWAIVWNAGYRGYLQQLTAGEQAEFQAQHLAEIEQLCTAGDGRLNTGVLIAVGVIPVQAQAGV